ncbi:acyl-CoA thioester hydrolase [Bacillus mesophilus]|uniref:Acyl-CoA thioesterase n=1 Tax=Bacillus mesophilus TaxID=1808955 RepID=A0A6M0QBY3_9BACI|nr:thioesterase family protein [Bacillus mesophilus]MBM7660143.1 acyl-CoA thioester hydrolase [Bacillus mesophilus]NEY73796.1 acyl-CoA thioesterase [Bacillus mesophilus]
MTEHYRFTHRLKVRYSEIDGQKIVFNAHYLTYLDIAVSEYFEEGLKLNMQELTANNQFDFVVVKSTLEYKSSATLGDWLNVSCCMKSMGRSSFTMAFKITREEDQELILLGEIVYVSYDSHTKSSVPVPDFIRERIGRFEKG